MVIETQRLILLEITWKDLTDIHWLHSFPEVDEFNTLGIPENLEVTRKVMQSSINDQKAAKRREIQWSIRLIEEKTFIGLAGMRISEERFKMAEIFYKLAPLYWGNGYGTEVAKNLISFGFDTLKLHRIEAGTATQNIKSIRILEKAGMQREGTRRKILPIRGQWYDNYQYAIIEDDPRT